LHTLDDFKGKRIRAHGEMPAEVIRSLGAAPVFMGTGDVYLGLQRGTIDGVMTAPCLAWDKKYYECVRHYVHLKSSDLMSPPLTLMNLKTYTDLTPEFQKLIDTAARETEAFSLKLSTERSQECAKSLQGQKVEVYPLPDPERQRWAKACAPILQNYLKRNGEVGQSLVQEVENLKK
jgi:TRAP-type C4-dicarboxylate transport system substrate-binding protein